MRSVRQHRRPYLEHLESRLAPAVVSWDVDADGFWNVATNWRDDLGNPRLPGPADDVVIDRPAGNFTVTHQTGATTIRSLTSREALVVSGAEALAMTSASVLHGALTLSGGWLESASTLTTHGPVTWTGGGLRGAGTTTIAPDSTLDITGGTPKAIDGGHTLNNAGTIRFGGLGGSLAIGGTLHNLAAGTVHVLETTQVGGAFVNAGTVRVQGGTWWANLTGTATGTFQVDTGATLIFQNTYQLNPGAQLLGPGPTRFAGAIFNTFTVAGSLPVENLELASGTLRVTGSLTATRQFTWMGGFLEGAGTTTILTGATLRIQDFLLKRLAAGHTLNNAGTILFPSERTNLEFHGILNNQAGATLRVQVSDQVQFLPAGLSGTFNNAGRVEVLTGNFVLGQRAGTSTGAYHAAAGARMTLPGGHTFLSGAAFTGPGLQTLNGPVSLNGSFVVENLQFAGTLTGTHTLSGTFFWRTGSLSGPGTTTFTAGSTFTIGIGGAYQFVENGRVIHNHGTAVLTAGNELSLYGDGNTFVNELGGVFRVPDTTDISSLGAGAFVNAGTLEVQSGTLRVDARFTNTGTVRVQAGTLYLSQTFTNFAAQTLTGGAYDVAGTLKFTGADVRTNAAALTLDGPNARVVNQTNADALTNFAANTAGGGFTLRNGAYLARVGDFSNAGAVGVEPGSFVWLSGTYTQTAGRTRLLDGGLMAAAVSLQGGVLDGTGYVVGNVLNAARLDVGGAQTAGMLFLFGNYVQTAAGVLNLELGGLELGSQYDYLYIDGSATLGGTLNLGLLGGFVPNPDDFFVILSAASIAGDFATINGLFVGGDRALYPFHDGVNYYLWTYSF